MKQIESKKHGKSQTILLKMIDVQSVGGLVLGWPINMDGSAGPRCDSVRDFAHAFLKLQNIPIAFQDERMSTKAVESAMLAADMTRAKRAQRRDALAACWILQSALDAMNGEQARSTLKNTPPNL